MKTTDVPILACGHEPTATATAGTGWGIWTPSGERLCYECLDARERQSIENGAPRFVGYIDGNRMVTTWSGGRVPWKFSSGLLYER